MADDGWEVDADGYQFQRDVPLGLPDADECDGTLLRSPGEALMMRARLLLDGHVAPELYKGLAGSHNDAQDTDADTASEAGSSDSSGYQDDEEGVAPDDDCCDPLGLFEGILKLGDTTQVVQGWCKKISHLLETALTDRSPANVEAVLEAVDMLWKLSLPTINLAGQVAPSPQECRSLLMLAVLAVSRLEAHCFGPSTSLFQALLVPGDYFVEHMFALLAANPAIHPDAWMCSEVPPGRAAVGVRNTLVLVDAAVVLRRELAQLTRLCRRAGVHTAPTGSNCYNSPLLASAGRGGLFRGSSSSSEATVGVDYSSSSCTGYMQGAPMAAFGPSSLQGLLQQQRQMLALVKAGLVRHVVRRVSCYELAGHDHRHIVLYGPTGGISVPLKNVPNIPWGDIPHKQLLVLDAHLHSPAVSPLTAAMGLWERSIVEELHRQQLMTHLNQGVPPFTARPGAAELQARTMGLLECLPGDLHYQVPAHVAARKQSWAGCNVTGSHRAAWLQAYGSCSACCSCLLVGTRAAPLQRLEPPHMGSNWVWPYLFRLLQPGALAADVQSSGGLLKGQAAAASAQHAGAHRHHAQAICGPVMVIERDEWGCASSCSNSSAGEDHSGEDTDAERSTEGDASAHSQELAAASSEHSSELSAAAGDEDGSISSRSRSTGSQLSEDSQRLGRDAGGVQQLQAAINKQHAQEGGSKPPCKLAGPAAAAAGCAQQLSFLAPSTELEALPTAAAAAPAACWTGFSPDERTATIAWVCKLLREVDADRSLRVKDLRDDLKLPAFAGKTTVRDFLVRVPGLTVSADKRIDVSAAAMLADYQ